MAMQINNPRRILAVGAPDSGVLHLLTDLTGSSPVQVHDDNSTAGLCHTWPLKSKYFEAEIPVWIDEIPQTETWRVDFTKPEAREVVTALGAWIYCFRKPLHQEHLDGVKETMKAISDVNEKACGYSWDGVCLAVAMPQSTTPHLQLKGGTEEWEDMCRELGFEYIDFEATGRNEFGEVVGVARVKEALEANDWAGDEFDGDNEDFDGMMGDDDEEWGNTFAAEEAEINMELFGMKSALNGGMNEEDGHANGVEGLEVMMSKLQAVKDGGADMPEAERKKYAIKAVKDLMKDF